MLHEIEPKLNNAYMPLTPVSGDFAVCFRDDCLLLAGDADEIRFPSVGEARTAGHYLFSVGADRYFSAEADALGGYAWRDAAFLRFAAPKERAFAAVTALHLLRWYRDHRFCGRCGREMRHSEAERAMVCDCGNLVYPRICPAVIVGVLHEGHICLTKYNRPNARWALVAGYTEIGETLERTVTREVKEETGLTVTDVTYYKSQPWGLSGSLLAGFFCRVSGNPAIRVDHKELKEGRWFAPEEINFPDDGFSLTRAMIEAFRTGEIR